MGTTERLINFALRYPLDVVAHFFLLLPVVVGFYRQKYLTPVLKGISLFFLVRFIEESILLYVSLLKPTNQNEQKIFMLIDILLICFIYSLIFKDKPTYKKITYYSAIIIEAVLLYLIVFHAKNGLSGPVMRFYIIIITLIYYNFMLAENRVKNILYHSMFWINAGFLIYAMGTFMTSLFIDYLIDSTKESNNTFDLFWNMSQVVICIQCILMAIGMYFAKKERTNQLSRI